MAQLHLLLREINTFSAVPGPQTCRLDDISEIAKATNDGPGVRSLCWSAEVYFAAQHTLHCPPVGPSIMAMQARDHITATVIYSIYAKDMVTSLSTRWNLFRKRSGSSHNLRDLLKTEHDGLLKELERLLEKHEAAPGNVTTGPDHAGNYRFASTQTDPPGLGEPVQQPQDLLSYCSASTQTKAEGDERPIIPVKEETAGDEQPVDDETVSYLTSDKPHGDQSVIVLDHEACSPGRSDNNEPPLLPSTEMQKDHEQPVEDGTIPASSTDDPDRDHLVTLPDPEVQSPNHRELDKAVESRPPYKSSEEDSPEATARHVPEQLPAVFIFTTGPRKAIAAPRTSAWHGQVELPLLPKRESRAVTSESPQMTSGDSAINPEADAVARPTVGSCEPDFNTLPTIVSRTDDILPPEASGSILGPTDWQFRPCDPLPGYQSRLPQERFGGAIPRPAATKESRPRRLQFQYSA